MPLHEFYENKVLSATTREKHRCIVCLKRRVTKIAFNKICRIIDEVLDQIVNENLGKLVYTRTGFLLGHSSIAPHADVNYIWEKIPYVLINKTTDDLWHPGESKLVLQSIGSLVM